MNTAYFNIKKTFILSIIIFVILQILNIAMGSVIHFDNHLLINFGFTVLYTFSLSYANGQVFCYLDKIFATERFSTQRLIVGFIATFLVSLIVIFLLHFFEEVLVNKKSFQEFINNEKPKNYLVSIIITFFVSLTIYSFQFYKSYQENKVKQQKIIAGTANAKFESLKNQIDPHFLFNSLAMV